MPSISRTALFTTLRIPSKVDSGLLASQLRLGNSMHNPTNSWSSSDQVIRYVYLSAFRLILALQLIYCIINNDIIIDTIVNPLIIYFLEIRRLRSSPILGRFRGTRSEIQRVQSCPQFRPGHESAPLCFNHESVSIFSCEKRKLLWWHVMKGGSGLKRLDVKAI